MHSKAPSPLQLSQHFPERPELQGRKSRLPGEGGEELPPSGVPRVPAATSLLSPIREVPGGWRGGLHGRRGPGHQGVLKSTSPAPRTVGRVLPGSPWARRDQGMGGEKQGCGRKLRGGPWRQRRRGRREGTAIGRAGKGSRSGPSMGVYSGDRPPRGARTAKPPTSAPTPGSPPRPTASKGTSARAGGTSAGSADW